MYNKVSQGEITAEQALPLLDNSGYPDFTLGQLEALYQSKKTVKFIDTPKGAPYSSVVDLYDSMLPFFTDFDDALDNLRQSQERFIQNYVINREKHMQEQLNKLIAELSVSNPGKDLKILLQLGYNHRSFYKDLKSADAGSLEVSAKYLVSVFPYAYSDEFGARFLKNKEIDKDLLAKCWLERNLEQIVAVPDDSIKYIKYMRKMTGAFSTPEISAIFDRVKAGEDLAKILPPILQEKNLIFPDSKEVWEKIAA